MRPTSRDHVGGIPGLTPARTATGDELGSKAQTCRSTKSVPTKFASKASDSFIGIEADLRVTKSAIRHSNYPIECGNSILSRHDQIAVEKRGNTIDDALKKASKFSNDAIPNAVHAKLRVDKKKTFVPNLCSYFMRSVDCPYGANCKRRHVATDEEKANPALFVTVVKDTTKPTPISEKKKVSKLDVLAGSAVDLRQAKIFTINVTDPLPVSWMMTILVFCWFLLGIVAIAETYDANPLPHCHLKWCESERLHRKYIMYPIYVMLIAFPCWFRRWWLHPLSRQFSSLNKFCADEDEDVGDIDEYKQSDCSFGFVATLPLYTPYSHGGISPMSNSGFHSYTMVQIDQVMYEYLKVKQGPGACNEYTQVRYATLLHERFAETRPLHLIEMTARLFDQDRRFSDSLNRLTRVKARQFESR